VSYLLGIDIYNGNSDGYDMAQVKADGVDFVIHKASQGWAGGPGGWEDWKMVGALGRARDAGLIIGGYHWLLKGNGAAQCQNFIASLQRLGGPAGMLACIDFERNDWNQALNPDTATLMDFIAEWDRTTGGQPIIIYNAAWYHNGVLGAGSGPWASRPLWVADYLPNGPTPVGQLAQQVTPGYFTPFGGWQAYAIRQFSSNALVAGQQSDVDIFFGTTGDLLAYTRSGSGPVPTSGSDPLMAVLQGLAFDGSYSFTHADNVRVEALQLFLAQAGAWIAPHEKELVRPWPARYQNLRDTLGAFQGATKTGNPDGSPDYVVGPATAAALCKQTKVF